MADTQHIVVLKEPSSMGGNIKRVFLVLKEGMDLDREPVAEAFTKLQQTVWERDKLVIALYEPARANGLAGLDFLIRETR